MVEIDEQQLKNGSYRKTKMTRRKQKPRSEQHDRIAKTIRDGFEPERQNGCECGWVAPSPHALALP